MQGGKGDLAHHHSIGGVMVSILYNKNKYTKTIFPKMVLKKHFEFHQLYLEVITITGYSDNDLV